MAFIIIIIIFFLFHVRYKCINVYECEREKASDAAEIDNRFEKINSTGNNINHVYLEEEEEEKPPEIYMKLLLLLLLFFVIIYYNNRNLFIIKLFILFLHDTRIFYILNKLKF